MSRYEFNLSRCNRCKKLMFIASETGFCKKCNAIVVKEQELRLKQLEEEHQIQEDEQIRKIEVERQQQEIEQRRIAEEQRQRQKVLQQQRQEEQQRYDHAIEMLKNAKTSAEAFAAYNAFLELGGYKDSEQQATEAYALKIKLEEYVSGTESRQNSKNTELSPDAQLSPESINKKANTLIMSEAIIFHMEMKLIIGQKGITYDDLKSIIRRLLNDKGMSEKELDLVNYDEFIEPYVDEIDDEEDSYISIQNKQRIMETIRNNKQLAEHNKVKTKRDESCSTAFYDDDNQNNNTGSVLYSWIPELKQMFAAFIPVFEERISIDEDAWRRVNVNHMTWAQDALELKRKGKYLEACQLYFPNIMQNGSCTLGWAQGVFKTLAVAGDIEDALVFGRAWSVKNNQFDMLGMHWVDLLNMVKNEESYNQIPEYLQSISGNPSYAVDLKRTDLYTSPLLLNFREEEMKKAEERRHYEEEEIKRAEEEKKRKAEEELRRRQEEERKADEERQRQEEQRKAEEERQDRQRNTAGLEKVSSFHTKVVGVTFKNNDETDRQRIIRDLIRNNMLGIGTELQLIPEPDNPYDRNCIRVLAVNGQQIGTLSRDIAAKVAPKITNGSVYKAYVSSHNGGDVGYSYGINIRIDEYKRVSSYGRSKSSSYDDFYDVGVDSIVDIARSEGYSIDDDGHWVPLQDDNDW